MNTWLLSLEDWVVVLTVKNECIGWSGDLSGLRYLNFGITSSWNSGIMSLFTM